MSDSGLLAKAISLAAEKHRDQKRRDGSPYIYHPLNAARIVKNAGFGYAYQIAAVLHDILEDTDTTEEMLGIFGPEVVRAVVLLTRPEGADETEYLSALKKDPVAAVVKSADKIDNLSDSVLLGDPAFFSYYLEKADRYYKNSLSKAVDEVILRAERFKDGSEFVPVYLFEKEALLPYPEEDQP